MPPADDNEARMKAVQEALEKRRRYPRVPMKLSMELQGIPADCRVLNASAQGLCFETSEDLDGMKVYGFRIRLEKNASVGGQLTIQWRRPAEKEKGFCYGAKAIYSSSEEGGKTKKRAR